MFLNETQLSAMSYSDVRSTLRRVMPDLYFVNASVAQMRRHLKLLSRLPQQSLILDFHQNRNSPLTELTLCAYDDSQPGLLSKVCGTLTALRINVQTAFIHTLKLPSSEVQGLDTQRDAGRDERWVVLDTLLLNEPYSRRPRALTATTVQRVQQELTRVLRDEMTVAQLMAKMHRRPYPPLHIYDVSASNHEHSGRTVITLRAQDDTGVLYRTTVALAGLGLNIHVAQINTADQAIDDIFYVTDAQGRSLPEHEVSTITTRLRAILQDSSAPFGLTGEF